MKCQLQWKRTGRNYFAPGATYPSYEEAAEAGRLRAKGFTSEYRIVELNGNYKELTLGQVEALIRLEELEGSAMPMTLLKFFSGTLTDLPGLTSEQLQDLVDASTSFPMPKLKQLTRRSLKLKRKILQYRTAAENFEGQVELEIEEDCEVTLMPNGALVQTWLFIPSELIKE